jgi:hypothetical protein
MEQKVSSRGIADPSASLLMTPMELHIEYRGIPHLAKNVRDVGHPTFVAGTESRSLISQLTLASRLLGMTKQTATVP